MRLNKMTRSYTLGKMGVDSTKASTLPQYIAALSVCLGAVAAGTVLGWTANISEKVQDDHALNDIVVDDDEFGWIGSFATLGAMLMCFPIGYICDFIGRKWGCLITVVPFSIGWALIIFSSSNMMIYVGRFLTGLAGGAFCVAAPIYTSEIAQKEIRGALGSYFQLLLTVGILISYVGGACMDPKSLSILCAMVPLVFAVIFFFQPETPVYYLKKNDRTAATKSLQRLRGSHYNVDAEIKEIEDSLQDSNESTKVSFWASATTVASKKACLICFGLMFFQQMSGTNAVIFYTRDIFKAAGSTLDPALATIIIGIVQTVATFLSSLIVDRFGRKVLLLFSIFFMTLSGFVLGVFFTLKDREVLDADGISSIGFIPVLCLIVFIAVFSLGFGPIPWLISAELMPPEIKSVACSSAATFNWLLAFIVTKFYATVKKNIGGDTTFYIFAGIALCGTCFVFLLVPETKGKSTAEVQAILSGEGGNASSNKKYGVDNPNFQKA